jgi:hypothetical protein
MAFNAAAVDALFASVESIAMKTGQFRSVNTHEPKSAPGSGLRCAIWAQSVEPLPGASGLNSTTGYVIVAARAYGNMLAKPEDEQDPRLMKAATALIGAFSADFTLGGTVRNVDLLGEFGQRLAAQAGYVTIGGSLFRIMTVTVPCIVNDMWDQVSGS